MEADAVIYRPALGWASEVQSKKGRRDQMSTGIKSMMGKTIETAERSQRDLNDSMTGEPTWDRTRPSECGWEFCVLGSLWGRWQWDQVLFWVHELTGLLEPLAFGGIPWSVFIQGRGPSDFADPPPTREAYPLLGLDGGRNWGGGGWGRNENWC